MSIKPKNGLNKLAVPSVIAASITWPCPEVLLSTKAARIPESKYIAPPPKSPTRLRGGAGGRSGYPIAPKAPAMEM